jgi:hypothetical protein
MNGICRIGEFNATNLTTWRTKATIQKKITDLWNGKMFSVTNTDVCNKAKLIIGSFFKKTTNLVTRTARSVMSFAGSSDVPVPHIVSFVVLGNAIVPYATSTALVPLETAIGASATSTALVPFETIINETKTVSFAKSLVDHVVTFGKSAWLLATAHPIITTISLLALFSIPTVIFMVRRKIQAQKIIISQVETPPESDGEPSIDNLV